MQVPVKFAKNDSELIDVAQQQGVTFTGKKLDAFMNGINAVVDIWNAIEEARNRYNTILKLFDNNGNEITDDEKARKKLKEGNAHFEYVGTYTVEQDGDSYIVMKKR